MVDQLQEIRSWLLSKRTLSVAGAIMVVALVVSWGAMRVVAGKLALPDGAEISSAERIAGGSGSEDAAPRRKSADRARSLSWYKRPIVKRNIFDPDAVGAMVEASESEGKTDLPVKLIATVVTDPSQFSTALILEDKRGEEAKIYTIGDSLLGEATIEEILWRKVLIRKDGELQAIPMDATKILAKPRASSRGDDSDTDGIEKNGEDQYTVPQSVVDNALLDLDKLASQVRVRPHRDADGNVDGYRLSAVRRGTLLDKLGIKNGDIVHEVNGYPLNSSSGAMTAFQSLQTESSFQFDISRRNKRRTLKYDVR
jgi:general secretion pathway protein C